MAKDFLSDYESKAFKGLSDEELAEFGIKKKDGKFKQKEFSVDGKPFAQWLAEAEAPKMRHGKDGQMHEVIDYRTGEAMPANERYAEMLNVFKRAGVPTEEIPNVARQTNVRNFSTDKDGQKEAQDMLKTYLDKHTSQKELEKAVKEKAPAKREPIDRPVIREDLNEDLNPISQTVIEAQERLDNPLIPLYEGQDELRDNPEEAARYKDHFIVQKFYNTGTDKMAALYNAMNAVT